MDRLRRRRAGRRPGAWSTPRPAGFAQLEGRGGGVASATPRWCSPCTSRSALEKPRLSAARAELARLQHGIDQLEDVGAGRARAEPGPAGHALREVSEDARRARQVDRAAELDEALGAARGAGPPVARRARRLLLRLRPRGGEGLPARRRRARRRSSPTPSRPSAPIPSPSCSTAARPSTPPTSSACCGGCPYYRGEVKVGSLLAVPVRLADDRARRAGGRPAGDPVLHRRRAGAPRVVRGAGRGDHPRHAPRPIAARRWARSSRPSTRSRGRWPASTSRTRSASACWPAPATCWRRKAARW